mgnify:CR=1 FL=1
MLIAIAYGFARKVRSLLEVILHIGAHRTGTTTLQRSLQQNHHNLTKNGLTLWGPKVTRGGMFSGLLRGADAEPQETARLIARNKGVIRVELDRLATKGQKAVLVSEENMLGGIRGNLRSARLYPDVTARLARFADVFAPVCSRVALVIRPYEDFWASSLAHAIPQGHRMLDEDDLDRLVTQPRTWRGVINDVALAFPRAEIAVWEFDRLIGKTASQLRVLSGGNRALRLQQGAEWHNASKGRAALRAVLADRGGDQAAQIAPGDGRFMPFGAHHIEALRAQYAEDLAWLRDVSVGRLRFVQEVDKVGLGPQGFSKRGFG